MIVASGMLSMALTDKRIGLEQQFRPSVAKALVAKIISLFVPLWLLGVVFATVMHFSLGWPMNGSWSIVFAAQALMVLAGLAVGSLLYLAHATPPAP